MGNEFSTLHDAAAKDHSGAVRVLLEQEHVDPNLKDKVPTSFLLMPCVTAVLRAGCLSNPRWEYPTTCQCFLY